MDNDAVRCMLLGAVILCGLGLIYALAPNAHVIFSPVQTTGSP